MLRAVVKASHKGTLLSVHRLRNRYMAAHTTANTAAEPSATRNGICLTGIAFSLRDAPACPSLLLALRVHAQ